MPEPSEAAIRRVLDGIQDPCSLASGVPLGLNEMGLIENVTVDPDGAVTLKLRLTSPFCHMIGFFQTEATRLLGGLPGVTGVKIEADNGLDWSPSMISAAGQARREQHLARMRDAAPRRAAV